MQIMICRLFFLLMCSGIVASAEQGFKVEVEHVNAKLRDTSDPDVAPYEVAFHLRISNSGKQDVTYGPSTVFVSAIQARQGDGSWKTVINTSWYDYGNVKYSSCA